MKPSYQTFKNRYGEVRTSPNSQSIIEILVDLSNTLVEGDLSEDLDVDTTWYLKERLADYVDQLEESILVINHRPEELFPAEFSSPPKAFSERHPVPGLSKSVTDLPAREEVNNYIISSTVLSRSIIDELGALQGALEEKEEAAAGVAAVLNLRYYAGLIICNTKLSDAVFIVGTDHPLRHVPNFPILATAQGLSFKYLVRHGTETDTLAYLLNHALQSNAVYLHLMYSEMGLTASLNAIALLSQLSHHHVKVRVLIEGEDMEEDHFQLLSFKNGFGRVSDSVLFFDRKEGMKRMLHELGLVLDSEGAIVELGSEDSDEDDESLRRDDD